MFRFQRIVAAGGIAIALAITGCDAETPPEARSPDASDAAAVVPTGEVVEIRMISTPGQGELFEPADVTVQRGDVVRFVLETGVHNASFPADRNPSGVDLPAATPYLQAPGQTHDLVVDLPPGEYFYQCDPHVPMGMVGTITVEP